MNALGKLNDPLDYIEENLANNIDFKEVARLSSCSQRYYRKIFSIMAGINLSEYIRRRRLTLAAFELNNLSMRILDIAIKYGYSSPDSFARAFQAFHGITPSQARGYGKWLKFYSRMTFQLLDDEEDTCDAKDKENNDRKQ